MAFSLPNFNLTCNIWDPGHSPGAGDPPDFSAVPCQLYVFSRTNILPGYMLRIPKGITGLTLTAGTFLGAGSGFELSGMPGHFFSTLTRPFIVHCGFPNEYYATMLIETDDTFTIAHTPNVVP